MCEKNKSEKEQEMAANSKDKRQRLGYGSSYKKGNGQDLNTGEGIGAVLGSQVWKIKPDKKAKAANPCLWMQASVVEYKSCNNFYDCTTCKYDLGMKKQVDRGKQTSWQDAMRKYPPLERVCRHSLTNRIPSRLCAYDYQCASCDFDQFFEDVWTAKTQTVPTDVQQVKGFSVPMDYYFHDGHTWARIESGGYIRIGLDDFALKLLGKADALDLPLVGKELDQGVVGWGLKRKDNLADVLSPVGGVIMEVNSSVRENPEIANDEPYGGGWLFMVRNPNIKNTVKPLMADADSLDWMNREVDTLENMIEDVAGPLAADGGYLQTDIFGNVPDLGWQNLTKTFLRT
jgi:glycine cleavage system H lipoate-binding protein